MTTAQCCVTIPVFFVMPYSRPSRWHPSPRCPAIMCRLHHLIIIFVGLFAVLPPPPIIVSPPLVYLSLVLFVPSLTHQLDIGLLVFLFAVCSLAVPSSCLLAFRLVIS